MKQIRIITKVERTPVRNLNGLTRISEREVRLPSGITWQPLDIKPHAQLSITDKTEDNNTVWSAKLAFKTCDNFKNGQYRLIGTDGRPYPVTSVNDNAPENVTENQLIEVTVNWQSPQFVPFITE